MIAQDVFNLVLKHFFGDKNKTYAWFETVNPSLGYVTPHSLIKNRKLKKLCEFALKQFQFPI